MRQQAPARSELFARSAHNAQDGINYTCGRDQDLNKSFVLFL